VRQAERTNMYSFEVAVEMARSLRRPAFDALCEEFCAKENEAYTVGNQRC
jgi:hypothetical protein